MDDGDVKYSSSLTCMWMYINSIFIVYDLCVDVDKT